MLATLSHSWQQVTTVRKQNGTAALLKMGFDRAAQKLLGLDVNTIVWFDVATLKIPPRPEGDYEFRFLTADEVAHYSADPVYLLTDEMVARARGGKDLCFAVLSGGRLAAFGWYALECIEAEHASGVAMSYPADVAYMYFGFTHPDFRGQRLHGLVIALALEALAQERGITKLVSMIAWTNWASLKSCRRLGDLELGNMVTLGWRRCRTGFYPREARRLGVRFGRSAARRSK